MKAVFKFIGKLIAVLGAIYAALFVIFFLDLDGKLLYTRVEPFLVRHYDRMERKDPLKQQYDTEKPRYEYG